MLELFYNAVGVAMGSFLLAVKGMEIGGILREIEYRDVWK